MECEKEEKREKFNGFSNKCGGSENLWDSISLSIGITCKFRSTLMYSSSTHVLRMATDISTNWWCYVFGNIATKQKTHPEMHRYC